jgi:hypothetical protein
VLSDYSGWSTGPDTATTVIITTTITVEGVVAGAGKTC